MIKSFLSLRPEAFGLDISDLSLKVVKLKRGKGGLGLASFGDFFIEPGVVSNGEIKDENALVKSIKNALGKVKGEKLRIRHIIASLPEEKSFLQVIQMPRISKEDLKSAVVYEAENYIPLPIEKVYLDYQVIPPVYGHLDHLDVLIAALPKETVDPYVSCFKKAGLIANALEIESQAISRALVKNELSLFPLLLIDMGATRTSLIVFSGHSLRFTSSISVSSNGFTEAISRYFKISADKAEKLKIKCGLNNKSSEEKRVFEALIPSLTDLSEQIKRYVDYYQTHHAGHEHLPPGNQGIKRAFLCGGGANLRGLADFLSRELEFLVEVGNPWVNILPEPLREVPELSYRESLRYTTALGLALRGINPET